MDKRQFWSTKSPLPEFHAVTFSHPAMSQPFRLVANQFAEVALAGQVHTPAPMSLQPPAQSGDATPAMSLTFPRAVVGRTFKQQLKLIQASGSREAIAVTYAVYLGDTDAPQVTWSLYAAESGGVSFSSDSVTVRATLDNPMTRAVAPRYTPDVYTGLELIA